MPKIEPILTERPWQAFTVSDQVKCPTESKAVIQQVERIWTEAKRKKGTLLFDAPLFQVLTIEPPEIIGQWIPYSYYFAVKIDPTLYQELPLAILSVNGVTQCEGQLLIGRRSPDLVNYPSYYECAPSGTVDPSSAEGNKVKLIHQLKKEFEEETALSQEEIEEVGPLLLYYLEGGIYAVAAKLTLASTALQRPLSSREYSSLGWYSRASIESIKAEFIPFSLCLIEEMDIII